VKFTGIEIRIEDGRLKCTHMCTRVKVLGAIACVEEEGFVMLNLSKLMAKALNL